MAGILTGEARFCVSVFLDFFGSKDPSEWQAEGIFLPPETKIKVQMLQRIIILFFSIIVWRGAGERAQIWEIVADKVPV